MQEYVVHKTLHMLAKFFDTRASISNPVCDICFEFFFTQNTLNQTEIKANVTLFLCS